RSGEFFSTLTQSCSRAAAQSTSASPPSRRWTAAAFFQTRARWDRSCDPSSPCSSAWGSSLSASVSKGAKICAVMLVPPWLGIRCVTELRGPAQHGPVIKCTQHQDQACAEEHGAHAEVTADKAARDRPGNLADILRRDGKPENAARHTVGDIVSY